MAPVFIETNFNRQQFNKECKLIIEQIKDRFIDLAPVMIDDEGSNYVDAIQEKQARFRQEMETRLIKQKFEFQYPQPLVGSDQERENPFALLDEMDTLLREGLAEIHDIF